MRVLMLSKACVVGIYQRKLEEIARLGIDLLALVPPSWRDERGETKLERAFVDGYRLEVIPMAFNGSFHLHFYPGLGRHIQQFRPHLVHIDEEPYNVSAWQALFHARRVGAKTLFFSWQNIQRSYPPPFAWGERWLLDHVDYAFAGSESAAQVWREKGYGGPLSIVPQFGVDPALFAPAAVRPERPFTIGYFGRLVEEKGLRLLLMAASRLAGDWRMRLVGSGPLRGVLEDEACALGIRERVWFGDALRSVDMPGQYHQIDAFVLPSLTRPNWKEQFGRVLVEAMASGVPVIGSDSGAIPDVVGGAGLIFPEGDAEALAQRLGQLQNDTALRLQLSREGRAHILECFTHRSVAEATVQVYRALLEPAPQLTINVM